MEFVGLFLYISGFIIGLGAVTVIDTLGFFGIRSPYFTDATIRAHKITKPLIWLGMLLAITGGSMFYSVNPPSSLILLQGVMAVILIINGCFLSFYVSPKLLQKEKKEKGNIRLLGSSLQKKIAVSFIISFLCWWGSVLILVIYLTTLL